MYGMFHNQSSSLDAVQTMQHLGTSAAALDRLFFQHTCTREVRAATDPACYKGEFALFGGFFPLAKKLKECGAPPSQQI
jgi:hypothetical protein